MPRLAHRGPWPDRLKVMVRFSGESYNEALIHLYFKALFMYARSVIRRSQGRPTSDGAGVRLTRVITPGQSLDPFLMLDEFDSNEANDYIGGFPAHPHRGFETVTYMLDGHMLHEDHMGNRGDLKPGGAQWMTAARGIIHSEMPQQIAGRMRGFQLWLNLPSHLKMQPASYRDIEPEEIPEYRHRQSVMRVIAGQLAMVDADEVTVGAVADTATQALYVDVILAPLEVSKIKIPSTHRALVYVYEHSLEIGETRLAKGELGELSDGDSVELAAGAKGARLLLMAARPIQEPVVHYGPFVMNTAQEIEQAVMDFRSGRLTA